MVNYNDRNFIYDLVKINLNAIITLHIPTNKDVDWDELNQYKIISQHGFRIASRELDVLLTAKSKDFLFFSLVPARFGYQLNALIDMGVCAVRISGQLAHEMNFLETIDIEKRIIVNTSDSFLEYNPFVGSWFRPEDLKDLKALDVCEFQAENIYQEQALYRIYAERQEWPGRLSEIILDISDQDIMNRMLPPEFTKQRLNCRQACMNGGTCHYCEKIMSIAKMEYIKRAKDLIDKEEE